MGSQDPYIKQFSELDKSSPQFPDQLNTLLDVEEYRDRISKISDEDAVWLVGYLDGVRTPVSMRISLSKVGVGFRLSPSYQLRLQEMPGYTHIDMRRPEDTTDIVHISRHLPNHQFPPGCLWNYYRYLRRGHRRPQGFRQTGSDLFPRHAGSSEGRPSVPSPPPTVLKEARKFYQGTIMWKHGKHPNIVPFLGVTIVPLQLISDWMSGGNIMEYLKKHPGANRLGLVCFLRAL